MVKKLLLSFVFCLSAGVALAQTSQNQGREGQQPVEQTTQMGENETLKLFIPNAFTPNDDGINDFFYITSANFSEFSFSVFDRWGNQVYTANNPNFRWDGKINGKALPTDIYVFVFAGRTNDNLEIKRSGTISIVR